VTGPQGPQGVIGPQGPTGPIGGSNTQVFFNNNGATAGSANLTFNLNGNVFTVGSSTITANVSNNSVTMSGNLTATMKSSKDFMIANTNTNAANTVDLSISNYFRHTMTASVYIGLVEQYLLPQQQQMLAICGPSSLMMVARLIGAL